MAPAEDFDRSAAAMRASFLLSNMAPQVPGMNRGRWAQLEAAVRDLVANCLSAWIFTGPVFVCSDPIEVIGDNAVAVPTHFYKVVLCDDGDPSKEMFASVMPNISPLSPGLDPYAASVDFVEELTGLDFFDQLAAPEETELEAIVGVWF